MGWDYSVRPAWLRYRRLAAIHNGPSRPERDHMELTLMHGSRQIVRTPSCRGLRPAKATNVGMLRSQHPYGWNRWMLQGTYSPRRLLKIRRPGLHGCDCRTPGMQRLQRSVSSTNRRGVAFLEKGTVRDMLRSCAPHHLCSRSLPNTLAALLRRSS